jgi:hypothetical protein
MHPVATQSDRQACQNKHTIVMAWVRPVKIGSRHHCPCLARCGASVPRRVAMFALKLIVPPTLVSRTTFDFSLSVESLQVSVADVFVGSCEVVVIPNSLAACCVKEP